MSRDGRRPRENDPKGAAEDGETTDASEAGSARGRRSDGSWIVTTLRELLTSAAIVGVVGLLLFGTSGVWPPMVAVESGSMQPHLSRGDLVVISEPGRYVPEAGGKDQNGIITREQGVETGYRTFGGHGSVVVYRPQDARGGTPVIHRAHFWVEEGENWYDKAEPEYTGGGGACETDDDPETDTGLRNCPAPHAGYITKGDNNGGYDQVLGISEPVKPDWLVGTAHLRIPALGHVRLWIARVLGAYLSVGGAGETVVVQPVGSG